MNLDGIFQAFVNLFASFSFSVCLNVRNLAICENPANLQHLFCSYISTIFAKTQNFILAKKENCNRQISLLRPMSEFYYKYTIQQMGVFKKSTKVHLRELKSVKQLTMTQAFQDFFAISYFLEKNRNVERLGMGLYCRVSEKMSRNQSFMF